jgi:glycerate kinase
MLVVCAPDSFKGSLSAVEAARAMADGVRDADPQAACREVPMADGGEGFVDVIVAALDARRLTVAVHDHSGSPASADLALAGDTAYLDIASAAGLTLVAPADRDIMTATSRGVGELVLAALDAGARRLVVGLGGSGTNDAGAGMLDALGVHFLDEGGALVSPSPAALASIVAVDASRIDPRLSDVEVVLASDVTNPLVGPDGASHVFGPQKGASSEQVRTLDRALAHLARCCERATGADHAAEPGAGAAGGLGYAFLQFLTARMRPGVEVVADALRLREQIRGADLVLTGEGSVDAQTLGGKTPIGVARIAHDEGVPVVIIAGNVGDDADVLLDHGVTAIVPTPRGAAPLEELIARSGRDLRSATASVIRIFESRRRGAAS